MIKNRFRGLFFLSLLALTVTGAIIAWQRYTPPHLIEISLPPPPDFEGEVYIGGAVVNPGLYPLKSTDSIGELVRAAGGRTDSTDPAGLKIYIGSAGEEHAPQRVDINRADAWLLETLPGIGPSRARSIIDYRQNNGGFHAVTEITEVADIGAATFEQIKELITVADFP